MLVLASVVEACFSGLPKANRVLRLVVDTFLVISKSGTELITSIMLSVAFRPTLSCGFP